MNSTSTATTLQETLRHFGSISNSLVYVTEELPSLSPGSDIQERIVAFACSFLEFLASYDTRLRNFLASLGPDPAQGPPGGEQMLEEFRRHLWEQIEGMHRLITDVRAQVAGQPCGPQLETLLNESGATILKAFLAIRELLDPLLSETTGARTPS